MYEYRGQPSSALFAHSSIRLRSCVVPEHVLLLLLRLLRVPVQRVRANCVPAVHNKPAAAATALATSAAHRSHDSRLASPLFRGLFSAATAYANTSAHAPNESNNKTENSSCNRMSVAHIVAHIVTSEYLRSRTPNSIQYTLQYEYLYNTSGTLAL